MISYLFLFPNFFSNTVFNDLQYHITLYITLHELAKQSNQQFTLIIIVETQNRKEVSSLLPSSTSPHAPD